MAESLHEEEEEEVFREELSPWQLLAGRSRSHRIPVRGQKDFLLDGSEEQRRRLDHSLTEHWSLLTEERVERLGNLVEGCWIPEEQRVELKTPAGKFWQTMGFSSQGRQYLLPEEALYLMECGNLQVFHQNLPLSVQDAYENFLSGGSVDLQQYQVFSHLKRLGYVVHRFDPSSEPSSYEQQLNLPQSRVKAAGLKRKRSSSPSPSSAPTAPPAPTDPPVPSTPSTPTAPSAPSSAPPASSSAPQQVEVASVPGAEGGGVGTRRRPERPPPAAAPRWDFSSICFPDLGWAGGQAPPGCLPPPDPALLPNRLSTRPCDVAPWRQKVNLRQDETSWKERRRDDDVHNDPEVQRCRNWVEYHELLARRRVERVEQPAHLWKQEVTPLLHPSEVLSPEQLLDKISVIQSTHLLDGVSRLESRAEWRIRFNVYHPDAVADFKKSRPGKAQSRVCVCSFSDEVPDLQALQQLALQGGGVQVVLAVVDHGDISFYTFKDFQLPRDVFS